MTHSLTAAAFVQNVQKAQAEQSGDANSTAAPAGADDSDANNGTASGASNNAPEPTQQPNIHMQRLAAIGNFFIGRRSQSDRAASGSGHDAAAHGSPSRSVLASDAQALSGRNMNLAVIENFVQQRPASAGSRGASQDLGDAAPQLSPERSCAGALGPEDGAYLPAAGVAVDEVFENERRQPFRGWGHSWPGHFLPTDPVGHWCRASGRSVKGGVSFEDNALDVPEGWTACVLILCGIALLCLLLISPSHPTPRLQVYGLAARPLRHARCAARRAGLALWPGLPPTAAQWTHTRARPLRLRAPPPLGAHACCECVGGGGAAGGACTALPAGCRGDGEAAAKAAAAR